MYKQLHTTDYIDHDKNSNIDNQTSPSLLIVVIVEINAFQSLHHITTLTATTTNKQVFISNSVLCHRIVIKSTIKLDLKNRMAKYAYAPLSVVSSSNVTKRE